jgi:hypothetical protein
MNLPYRFSGLMLVFVLTRHQRVAAQVLDSCNPFAGSSVQSIAVQPDGKVLVASSVTGFSRFNSDGTANKTFLSSIDFVQSIVVQGDDKILVGGNFRILGGRPWANLGRVNSDGTLDETYSARANGAISTRYHPHRMRSSHQANCPCRKYKLQLCLG